MICLLARPLRRVCGSEFVISLSIASETFLFFFAVVHVCVFVCPFFIFILFACLCGCGRV